MKKRNSIFNESFLASEMEGFRASSIPGIRNIIDAIYNWIEKLEAGRLDYSKEESIKSQFVTSFFGDVLGYNYGNANEWMLEEEKKSIIDATKIDCALGYFSKGKSKVFAVIEVKNSIHNLDSKQNRTNDKRTPVQQAFDYSTKMGGDCKWVIVTNLVETRFYRSNDQSTYQVYFLAELKDESKRNELLFLFHKDKLIKKEGKSATDKLLEKAVRYHNITKGSVHIVDEIYDCIIRFQGLRFVDPNYLATLYPFNILNEYVWHYHNNEIFTINPKIFQLLQNISIEDGEIIINAEIQTEIERANVVDAKEKLKSVFSFFNYSQIDKIIAIRDYKNIEEMNQKTFGFNIRHTFHFKEGIEGITKNIKIENKNVCDCLICNYRSLNFNNFLRKLKSTSVSEKINSLEFAYGNYLAATDNFKTSYNIYKSVEKEAKGKEGREIEYFLAKYNIKYLHNLVAYEYSYDDSKEILSDIKSVDLDKVIYDEIEYSVDKDVTKYLVKIKEENLIFKVQDEVEEIILKIEQLKKLYENRGTQWSGPNLPRQLIHTYAKLYYHVHRNFLVYTQFKRYKTLTEKVFKGLISSYQTKEVGLKVLNEFFLTEAILNIFPNKLVEILKPIDTLNTEEGCVANLLTKLNNFISSYYTDGIFGSPFKNNLVSEFLNNHQFTVTFRNIFSNIFTVLSKLNISQSQFQNSTKLVLNYLKIETELVWFDLKPFENFLLQKGDLFEDAELLKLLKIAIEGDKYNYSKYTDLIETLGVVIYKFYPNFKIDNENLIRIALLNCTSPNGKSSNFLHLLPLLNICSDSCKQILLETFETSLNNSFDNNLYEQLVDYPDFEWDKNNYFLSFTNYIKLNKGGATFKYGKQELTDITFIVYALIVYKLNIEFDRAELKLFSDLNNFETWILNPIKFDYNNFDVNWLTDVNNPIILNRLKNNQTIKTQIESHLNHSFDTVLAEISFKYFSIHKS
jgi:hypothetical protein